MTEVESEPGDAPTDETPAEAPEEALTPLEEMTAGRDKLKDQLLRVAADFDNFRKRSKKELELAERRGREDIVRDFLPIIDNLERAIDASNAASDVAAVREGVTMVLKLFGDTASKMGLERVQSVGERFDPNLHDAFQQKESDEHPPGTIIMEYQSGYRLGERLLRPAMVVVARKPAPPKTEPPPEAEETTDAEATAEEE